jgi:hypothetical protein
MEGLASSMAQPQQAQPQAAGGMPSVDEIVALLMEGIPPEELEKMGIPQELIMQAIQMLEQQMAAQQQQQAQGPQGAGLAQSMVG